LVGNLDAEFLFEGHDELDRVERVGPEVVDKRRVRRHLVLIDTQLLDNDLLDLVRNRHSVLLRESRPDPARRVPLPSVDGSRSDPPYNCRVSTRPALQLSGLNPTHPTVVGSQ